MTILDILLIVLILAGIALCIALIIYVRNISQAFKAMQSDLDKLTNDIQPLISSTSELTKKLSDISESAKNQVDTAKEIVYSIKSRVDTILEFEERVRKGIEGPVMIFIKEITAINKGLTTFLSYFRKNNS